MALYFRNTGANWGTASDWSATPFSSGYTTGTVPTAADDVIFEAVSGNCALGGNRVCKSINFATYANVLNVAAFTITVSGNITFQANQSSRISGTTGRLISAASGTITSNGGTWPLDYQISNITATITLADDMRVGGSWLGSGGGTVTLAGAFTLFVGTNITATNNLIAPVTNIVMNGSGTYSGNNAYNLEINTTGSITITGGVSFTRRFIITAVGTITMATANVTISNATTVNLGGRTIGNLTHSISAVGSLTITYLTDVVCSNFTIGNSGSVIYNGPGRVFVFGNYILGGSAASASTLVVELKGSGTISGNIMALSCVVNSSGIYFLVGATITLQSSISFTCTTPTLNTGTTTVIISNGVTIVPSTVNWYNITIPNNATITIN